MKKVEPAVRSQSRRIEYRFVDVDSGEVYASKRAPHVFFSHGEGEAFLHSLIDSLIRGISQEKNLMLEIRTEKVDVVPWPLFFD